MVVKEGGEHIYFTSLHTFQFRNGLVPHAVLKHVTRPVLDRNMTNRARWNNSVRMTRCILAHTTLATSPVTVQINTCISIICTCTLD